jgi:hypothetical protein
MHKTLGRCSFNFCFPIYAFESGYHISGLRTIFVRSNMKNRIIISLQFLDTLGGTHARETHNMSKSHLLCLSCVGKVIKKSLS